MCKDVSGSQFPSCCRVSEGFQLFFFDFFFFYLLKSFPSVNTGEFQCSSSFMFISWRYITSLKKRIIMCNIYKNLGTELAPKILLFWTNQETYLITTQNLLWYNYTDHLVVQYVLPQNTAMPVMTKMRKMMPTGSSQ